MPPLRSEAATEISIWLAIAQGIRDMKITEWGSWAKSQNLNQFADIVYRLDCTAETIKMGKFPYISPGLILDLSVSRGALGDI